MNLDEILQTFIVESRELLEGMEQALLQLEQSPADAELIHAIFRAAHTIKGSASLFGLEHLVIDLAIRLGRTPSPMTERSCIVVVELADNEHVPHGYKMGLVVDAVLQVLELAQGDRVPPPEFGTHLRLDFFRAMGRMTGISLSPSKQHLLVGRLARRVQALGCSNFGEYFTYLMKGKNAFELQVMVNLVTTNETYFFSGT